MDWISQNLLGSEWEGSVVKGVGKEIVESRWDWKEFLNKLIGLGRICLLAGRVGQIFLGSGQGWVEFPIIWLGFSYRDSETKTVLMFS